jgi:hypothetical protein
LAESGPASGRFILWYTRFIVLALVASACGVTTDVVMLDPIAPTYIPVLPDSVRVFASPNNVLIDYEPIATIAAGGRSSGTFAPDEADVTSALRRTAGRLGADGLILGELLDQRPATAADRTLPARGRATAIRLGKDPPTERSLVTAARPMEGIRTIAMSPVIGTDGLMMPDTIRAMFGEDAQSLLRAAGFEVLSGAVYDSIRTERILEVGGLFDPITGQRFDDRVVLVERRTRQALIEEYQAEGFLIQEIMTVPAYYSGVVAEWDGTRQSLIGPEEVASDLEFAALVVDLLLCSDETTTGCEDVRQGITGALPALSLMVRLENSIGAMLYTGRGGIELLELLDDTGEPYPQPPPHPFDTAKRNREAVALALAQLIGRSDP